MEREQDAAGWGAEAIFSNLLALLGRTLSAASHQYVRNVSMPASSRIAQSVREYGRATAG